MFGCVLCDPDVLVVGETWIVNLLLAPHSDDEALFATYLQLRHRPLVVICLEGRRARHLVPNHVRVAETAAATRLLGCDYRQLPVPCDPPDWNLVEAMLTEYKPDKVFAPLPEFGGHPHHNAVGNLAQYLWPGQVEFYATYTGAGDRSTVGKRVPEEPGWQQLKQRALACYRSQNSKPDTAQHFHQDLAEYTTTIAPAQNGTLRLNLGGGINPLTGFDNLDKTNGWMFEDGLGNYQNESVEAVTESHALMYVPLEHWPMVFSEIARVLKPGGVVRMTHDATDHPESNRQGLRHRAAVATTPEIVLDHMRSAGLTATEVSAHTSTFQDRSLMQQNYGAPPDVFFVEGVKP